MATAADILTVRNNTAEPSDSQYTDEDISDLVDSLGVAGTSADIWRQKAARFAGLVNVSESGASHSYSDLSRSALAMATKWEGLDAAENDSPAGHPRVKSISRP